MISDRLLWLWRRLWTALHGDGYGDGSGDGSGEGWLGHGTALAETATATATATAGKRRLNTARRRTATGWRRLRLMANGMATAMAFPSELAT